MLPAVTKRIALDRDRLAQIDARLSEIAVLEAKGTAGDPERQERAKLQQEREEIAPQWLLWAASREAPADDAKVPPEELAEKQRPHVLASFTNGLPFLVERNIGRGQTLLVSTGVFREWNTLTSTNAALIFDRIFRDLLERTLPRRNLASTEQLVVPVPADFRGARFARLAPDGKEEPIGVDAIGSDRYGVILRNLGQRGFYRVTAYGTKDTPQAAVEAKLLETIVAVNGPAGESELAALKEVDLKERMGAAEYRWVAQGETIQLAGAPIMGQDLWKWLMLAVLAGLLLELAMLAWPLMAGKAPAGQAASLPEPARNP
jgi:hypothetical protein